jgi:arylsulfatase A-like enzyme
LIREQLEKLGLSEDTLIIFTSDNGGDLRVTDNAPLRGIKSELCEGGIREPFLAFIPGVTSSNKVIDTPQQRMMISIQFYVNLQVLIKKITRILMV